MFLSVGGLECVCLWVCTTVFHDDNPLVTFHSVSSERVRERKSVRLKQEECHAAEPARQPLLKMDRRCVYLDRPLALGLQKGLTTSKDRGEFLCIHARSSPTRCETVSRWAPKIEPCNKKKPISRNDSTSGQSIFFHHKEYVIRFALSLKAFIVSISLLIEIFKKVL